MFTFQIPVRSHVLSNNELRSLVQRLCCLMGVPVEVQNGSRVQRCYPSCAGNMSPAALVPESSHDVVSRDPISTAVTTIQFHWRQYYKTLQMKASHMDDLQQEIRRLRKALALLNS